MDRESEQPLPCAEKLAFDTKQQADATANVTRYRYGTIVQAYKCRFCQLWHLSSQSYEV